MEDLDEARILIKLRADSLVLWDKRISTDEMRRRQGSRETVAEMMKRRRLEWLGHVARMPDYRTQKSVLFGWLPQPRPLGGH